MEKCFLPMTGQKQAQRFPTRRSKMKSLVSVEFILDSNFNLRTVFGDLSIILILFELSLFFACKYEWRLRLGCAHTREQDTKTLTERGTENFYLNKA